MKGVFIVEREDAEKFIPFLEGSKTTSFAREVIPTL
jgi:hypothetical protein